METFSDNMIVRGVGKPVMGDDNTSVLGTDISLVLNVHRGAKYLRRALRSLQQAVSYALTYGITTELIVVLDRTDAQTKSVLYGFGLAQYSWKFEIIEVDNGSLGMSRNDGVARAKGKWIGLCDEDDLISYNFYANMFFAAELNGPKSIQIPRWLMAFGNEYHFAEYPSLKQVTPFAFIDSHPFISRIFACRTLFEQVQFCDLPATKGYAYEDWHFNSEAVGLGYDFNIVDNTILFYRKNSNSLLMINNKISVGQIPPSSFFKPDVFRARCKITYELLLEYKNPNPIPIDRRGKNYFYDSICMHLIVAANRVDPAINLGQIRGSHEYDTLTVSNLNIGKAYYEVCENLRHSYTDVFLLPFFGKGGAERYFGNIINTLATKPNSRVLIILGEPHISNDWLSKISREVDIVNLAPYLENIADIGVDLIALKLVQLCAPSGRLHVRDSLFGQRFIGKFGAAIEQSKFFYMFSEVTERYGEFSTIGHWPFQFVAENWNLFNKIIVDNNGVVDTYEDRLGLGRDKFWFLPTLCETSYSQEELAQKVVTSSKRVLWASRLVDSKRWSLLPIIAKKLLNEFPDVNIDVFGEMASGSSNTLALKELANLHFHGPYESFEDIQGETYLCIIYTTFYDGIPTVILEASGAGIPIVAPAVGGVPEHVINNETGILLPALADDDAMAAEYVKAIVNLATDVDKRIRLVKGAHTRLSERHSRANFERSLAVALGE
jgi:glycosyltransferase involved in cell wall biosynthesis